MKTFLVSRIFCSFEVISAIITITPLDLLIFFVSVTNRLSKEQLSRSSYNFEINVNSRSGP